MIILDSNVISSLMGDPAESKVVSWLDSQDRGLVWTTSVTILEIRSGLQIMSPGRKQFGLAERFEQILDKIQHRIAPFDEEAAGLAADLMAARKKKGRVIEIRDTMIAGIVLAHRASLATRNTSHFDDIGAVVIDPWDA